MAISPSLQQFKSSGVYRLEFDKSQIVNIPSETIRLVIGFSKKGPFNTPVFVKDSAFFTTIFGDVDTALERKGSFFHRTVLTCLNRGPVIVLNLLKLTDSDTSQFRSVSTSASMANSPVVTSPVTSFFDTDKFWFADDEALVNYANNGTSQSVVEQRLLNIANTGRKTISVITKNSDILGFDVLAKDWFGVGKVPEFMNENDYVSDYMIDVVIVEGNFSNYTDLSIDPIFGAHFDSKGLKKTYIDQFGIERDGLTTFLNLDQVNVLGVYTGSIIPEFQDKFGENLFIEDIVNLETTKTGLLLGFDGEKLDDEPETISGDLIDLVGHTLESETPATLDYLSYFGTVLESVEYPDNTGGIDSIIIAATAGQTGANALISASTELQGATAYAIGYYDTITVYGPSATLPANFTSAFGTSALFENFRSEIGANSFAKANVIGSTAGTNFSKIISEAYNATTDILTLKISLSVESTVPGPTDSSISYLKLESTGVFATGGTATLPLITELEATFSDGSDIIAFVDSELYQNNLSGILTDGDKVDTTGATAYDFAEFTRISEYDFDTTAIGATCAANSVFGAETPILSHKVNYVLVNSFEDSDFVTPSAIASQSDYKFTTFAGNINESFELWSGATYTNPTTTVWLDNSATGPLGLGGFTGKIKKGQYLVTNFGGTGSTSLSPITGKSRLTRIISVSEITDPLSSEYQKIKVVTNEAIYIRYNTFSSTYEIERYKSIEDFIQYYRFHTLSGYTLTNAQIPDGTLIRQNEILDVMFSTGIANALIDRDVITYRYIVDSFEGGIEPASKVRLSRLAKNQKSSFAICNMPSVKQFKESTNPLFRFDSNSSFEAKYIASGGNLDLNPTNVFNLPGIADGSNYQGFYGPNLIVREGGKNISMPQAAHVSNLFIDKYNLALPFSIVAGPRRGVISGQGIVGVEYAFDRTDLDSIEPFGYNAILNKRGFGLVINANQTAQQTVKSALSQIHVRELIIYIQDGIEAILKNYQWEFNTAQNRLEIKTLADNFLNQILSDGGVYEYANIMDSSNNTPEIIDNNIGILDTYIEPVRGLGILVHRTTILKTGTISTGNFI